MHNAASVSLSDWQSSCLVHFMELWLQKLQCLHSWSSHDLVLWPSKFQKGLTMSKWVLLVYTKSHSVLLNGALAPKLHCLRHYSSELVIPDPPKQSCGSKVAVLPTFGYAVTLTFRPHIFQNAKHLLGLWACFFIVILQNIIWSDYIILHVVFQYYNPVEDLTKGPWATKLSCLW